MSVVYNKIVLCGLIIFYSLTGLVHSCHSATNLALGKPYIVSPQQNYPLTAPPSDHTSLTDGKYTTGYFWTQKSTLGWNSVRSVEILIDLENVSNINAISLSTARGKPAGVDFPVHVFAFIGPDKAHLKYVGDVVDSQDNKPGEYKTKRFVLHDLGIRGRYVLLEIQTSDNDSFFCDEIEVLSGNAENERTGDMTIEAARNMSEQTRKNYIEKEILAGFVKHLSALIAASPSQTAHLEKIKQRITTLSIMESTESLKTDILNFRAEALRAKFPEKQLMLESIDPWGSFSLFYLLSDTPLQRLSLNIPKNGYNYAAFAITNLSPEPRQISLSVGKISADAPELQIYQVPFVQTAAMEYIPDPLVPMKGALSLRSGESRMIFLSAVGGNVGKWQGSIHVTSGNFFNQVIPVNLCVLKPELPKEFSLNAINWGYLDFNLIKNLKSLAAKDLTDHHTNVLVVPSSYLQGANQVMPVDLSRLGAYLKQNKGVTKVLLDNALGDAKHKTISGKNAFMSKQWQDNFKIWYKNAANVVSSAGFATKQLYLYPYDEMEGQQIDDFITLSTWAKKEIPGIQFYATINNEKALRALPYLDVAQIVNRPELLRAIGTTKAEIWIYDSKSPAKSQSPYSYYRLMSWKAFLNGYSGIGFWAYADATGTAWDDFDGINPDYAVIYEGVGNSIISSRRWEAWRMGIEDYELLVMYGRTNGMVAAKKLAKSVLDNPDDTTRADLIRRQILEKLSE